MEPRLWQLSLGSEEMEIVAWLSLGPHSSETVGPVVVSVAQILM